MKTTTIIIAAATAMSVSAPLAMAQTNRQGDTQNRQRDSYNQQQSSRNDQSRQSYNQSRSQQGKSQNQPQTRGSLDPESITIVGYDLDRDGQTDAWYYVTIYDYERMRRDQARSQGQPTRGRIAGSPVRDQGQMSQMHRDRMSQMDRDRMSQMHRDRMSQMDRDRMSQMDRDRMDHMQSRGMQDRQPQQAMQQTARIQGQITKLDTFSFAPDGTTHLVGKVRTQQGQVLPVLFGAKNQIGDRISEGEQIRIMGSTAKLNGKKIILADRVQTRQGQINVQATPDQGLTKRSGTIVATKTINTADGGQTILARVRTDSGRNTIVALGSKKDMNRADVDLRSGKDISVLGSPARIDGKSVLIADHISIGGTAINSTASPSVLRQADNFTRAYSELRGAGQDAQSRANTDYRGGYGSAYTNR